MALETPGGQPDAAAVRNAIDYEAEKIDVSTFPDGIELFTDAACTTPFDPENDILTPYIAQAGEAQKFLYARYEGEEGTGEGVVTAVAIPARPASPSLSADNIAPGVTSLVVYGQDGVAYNYQETDGAGNPSSETAVICNGASVTFDGLAPETSYTVYARVPASNAEKRFHSAEVTVEVSTLAEGALSTTILVEAGVGGKKTYDLSSVIAATGQENITWPELTSGNADIVLSASGSGDNLTLVLDGAEDGKTTITGGTTVSITVEVLDPIKVEDGVFWTWEQVANAEGFLEAVKDGPDLLQPGEELDGSTAAGYTLKGRLEVGGMSAPTSTSIVTVPFFSDGDQDTPYAVFSMDTADSVTRLDDFTLTDDGVQFTGTSDTSYYLVKLSKSIPTSVTLEPVTLELTRGESAQLVATVIPTSATQRGVTWTSSDSAVVTVGADGTVTAVGVGTATITVTTDYGDFTATCSVTVKVPATPARPTYDVDVEDTDHGDVTVAPTRPHEGDEVTITPTPDEGYEVGEVAVTDEDGTALTVTDNGDGTWMFEQPAGGVTVTVTFHCLGGEHCPTRPFGDVPVDAWYHDVLDWAVEQGLLSGYADGTLGPDGVLSRAQLATVLWRQAGQPKPTATLAFGDCDPEAFYADAVAWAAEQGVILGYGDRTNFGPDDPVTREQLATILWRQAGEPEGSADLAAFPDGDSATAYAVPALEWAVGEGVLSGFGDGSLAPGGVLTRAMLAAMLQRISA